ncbi:hypothetical protein NEUTE2DRAFT_60002, partial [Neurospora tetrasperma FGSC 2509]
QMDKLGKPIPAQWLTGSNGEWGTPQAPQAPQAPRLKGWAEAGKLPWAMSKGEGKLAIAKLPLGLARRSQRL